MDQMSQLVALIAENAHDHFTGIVVSPKLTEYLEWTHHV